MDDPLNPLTEQHLQTINKALSQAQVARQAIAKAKSAGIDTGQAEADLTAAEQRLRSVKQVYFPGR